MLFKKTSLAIALAGLWLHAPLTQAQQANQATPTLSTIVVTADPMVAAVEIDPFSSVSTVVSEQILQDEHAVDLAGALRNTPGVQISRYNPVGSFGGDQGGAIFIRGIGLSRPGSEIKTYIDNVPMYMPVWNHPLLDLLPINGMSSITVNKSPQPQTNGNNFASINLTTKRATQDGIHGDAMVSAGSYGTFIEQANLLGKSGDWDFMLAQGYATSNGNRANASGQLNNVMGTIGYRLNSTWQVGASFLFVNNTARDPGDSRYELPAIAPKYNTDAEMFSAFVKHGSENWSGEFRAYTNSGNGNLYNDLRPYAGWGTVLSSYNMSGIRWQENISPWKNGNVRLGLDYDTSSGSFKQTPAGMNMTFSNTLPTYQLTSPYVAVNHNFNLNQNWSFIPSVGVRGYFNNQYASQTAPFAGLSLVSQNVTFFANASKGVNYPGLEGPALAAALGSMTNFGSSWKNITAEKMDHFEIGSKFTPDQKTEIDLSLFQDQISNRYVYQLNFGGNTAVQNLGSYTMRGIELSIRREITSGWTIYGGWTYLNNDSTVNLPYTPKQALSLAVNGKIGPVRVAVDAQYQSQVYALNLNRNTGETNNERVNAFTVANARFAYPIPALGKKGEAFVMVQNIFNTNYEYRPGYQMAGRWYQVGLAASF
jgi:iron complex outermembrane receptor protein